MCMEVRDIKWKRRQPSSLDIVRVIEKPFVLMLTLSTYCKHFHPYCFAENNTMSWEIIFLDYRNELIVTSTDWCRSWTYSEEHDLRVTCVVHPTWHERSEDMRGGRHGIFNADSCLMKHEAITRTVSVLTFDIYDNDRQSIIWNVMS